MKKYIYITLKQYAKDDEEYKKFMCFMKRFKRPTAGKVTLNGKVLRYRCRRRNNWMIQIERSDEEMAIANKKKSKRKCSCCEKNIPSGRKGDFCSDFCIKIHEDFEAHKSKYSGGSLPDMFKSHRIVGKPTAVTFAKG